MCRFFVVAVIAGGFLTGCTGGPVVPKTVPTGGVVQWKGKPLASAYVTFIAEDGQSAVGETDAQGQYKLTSHFGPKADAKGVVPRNYKVTVSKLVPPGTMTEEEYKQILTAANEAMAAGKVVARDKKPPQLVQLLPAKYSDTVKTELKATVGGEVKEFKFDLN
jgi:hypothetical protein